MKRGESIARAIADMALARSENNGQRFYSMSAQILRERDDYYAMLERSQKATLDVTAWQEWSLNCLHRAIEASQDTLREVLQKAHFWKRFAQQPFNARQLKVLNRLLDGFEGKLTTSCRRYALQGKSERETSTCSERSVISL